MRLASKIALALAALILVAALGMRTWGASPSDGRSVIYGLFSDGTSPVEIDDATHVLAVMDYEHHKGHEGVRYIVEEGIALNNSSKKYLIETPDSPTWAHLRITVSGSQDTSVLFEGEVSHTAGTAMLEVNTNGNSANTAGVVVTHTPGGAVGTPVQKFSARFGNAMLNDEDEIAGNGGVYTTKDELILCQNGKYLLTVTALSANTNNITVSLRWYEHQDKD
jgi:hypothetical protein